MDTQTKDLFLKRLRSLNRLFNDDEILDFYVEHVMRAQGGCKLSPYGEFDKKIGAFREAKVELKFYEIQQRARSWFRFSIGSLVCSGALKIQIGNGWEKWTTTGIKDSTKSTPGKKNLANPEAKWF